MYPLDKLHDDRMKGTVNVMVMVRRERPIVWMVSDMEIRMCSHDSVLGYQKWQSFFFLQRRVPLETIKGDHC